MNLWMIEFSGSLNNEEKTGFLCCMEFFEVEFIENYKLRKIQKRTSAIDFFGNRIGT